jgi:hypothetical protein
MQEVFSCMWRDFFEDFCDKIGGFDIFCQSLLNNLGGIFLIIFCWEHIFCVCQNCYESFDFYGSLSLELD